MKERPILFNGDMVRAILDGRKTQTRRVIKPQPMRIGYAYYWKRSQNDYVHNVSEMKPMAPCGVPGNRLWVRETFAQNPFIQDPPPWPCVRSGKCNDYSPCDTCAGQTGPYIYAATYKRSADGVPYAPCRGWRPSIHMPRSASRITLEVTGVRVERVREITDDDALAEGVTPLPRTCTMYHGVYRNAFAALWDGLHAKRGYGWDANPWVWVVEFRRVKG